MSLCTLEEVKFFGGINGATLDSRMDNMIEHMGDWLKNKTGSELTRENFNARMACIYGVLSWLENEGRIRPRRDGKRINKYNNGNIDVQFDVKQNEFLSNQSYQTEFESYLYKLLPMPAVGTFSDGYYPAVVDSADSYRWR